MMGRSYLLQYCVLAFVTCASAEYLLPDDTSFLFKQCIGPSCPMFSVPVNADKPGVHHSVNCTKGEVMPHASECQSFYVCRANGTGIKLRCSFGYAFHPRMKLCVPKSLVKSCGEVYCPPSILIGMVPDVQSCTRFYKCMYGYPMHYQCEPETVYDEELGRCIEYGQNIPTCVSGENNPATENPTTENPTTESLPTTTTTTTITTTAFPSTIANEEIITEEPISVPTTSDTISVKL